jgi:hypothetical protein
MTAELTTPLHILPIKRSLVLRIFRIKSMFNFLNLNWVILIIPFAVKGLETHYVMPITGLILIVLLLDYLTLLLKILIRRFGIGAIIILILLFSINLYFNLKIEPFFKYILIQLKNQDIAIIFGLIGLLILFDRLFIYIYRQEKYTVLNHSKGQHGQSHFEKLINIQNLYIELQLKLIIRNKRTTTLLFSTILIILLSIYLISIVKDLYITYYLLTCLVGAVGFSLGYHFFSMDSDYLSLIHSNKVNYTSYIKSKYHMLNVSSIIISALTFPIVAFNIIDFKLYISNLLLVMGICNHLIILIGITNSKKIDLSQSSFANSQGSDVIQIGCIFIFSFIPVLLLFLEGQFLQYDLLSVILMLSGLLPLFLSNKIISGYLNLFRSMKYIKLLNT